MWTFSSRRDLFLRRWKTLVTVLDVLCFTCHSWQYLEDGQDQLRTRHQRSRHLHLPVNLITHPTQHLRQPGTDLYISSTSLTAGCYRHWNRLLFLWVQFLFSLHCFLCLFFPLSYPAIPLLCHKMAPTYNISSTTHRKWLCLLLKSIITDFCAKLA